MRGHKIAYDIKRLTVYVVGYFLSSHSSSIKRYRYLNPLGREIRRGKVVFNSTIKKLTDVDGALPLNNKASYMIKLILVSQKKYCGDLIIK